MTQKGDTSVRLAFVIALTGGLLSGAAYAIPALATGSFSVSLLLSLSVLTAAVLFLVSRRLIRKRVTERLKQIYRTLYFLKPSESHEDGDEYRGDLLEHTGVEVEAWAKDRKEEMDRIRQLANYRRDFLGNVSHELKTPIFNIQGYLLTLLDGGLEDPSINREYLVRAEKSVSRLIAIVDDLSTIARMEAGELELKLERFDIAALCREVFEFLDIKARKKKARMYFEEKVDRPLIVMADKERIREVLINLVDNSIKYRRKEADSEVSVAFHDMDDHYLVEVTDNGIGMTDQDISRVFERFYRTERGRMQSHKGSGLGLAIVKHIIEAHDEKISVRSRAQEGTTFGFTLRKAGR